MSTKYLGIGLLSLGSLVIGAAGAYLAVKTSVPAPAEVAAAPVPPATAETPMADRPAGPTAAPVAVRLDGRLDSKPQSKPPLRTQVKPAVGPAAPTEPPPQQAPQSAVAPGPVPSPAATQPTAPVINDPPATTPVPVPTEAPRYVPDPPASATAATLEPRRVEFEELIVARHSVIGIRLDAPVSTRTARVEDRVTAAVSRDVTVAGRTAIAAGLRLEGTVVLVERGGRFKNRPRLGLQFDRMILADGTRVDIKTDTIFREGDSPSADATAKVGTGAVAGAILGAVIGGKKGAVIGTAAGAAGGVAKVMREDAGEASLAGGAPLTVRLIEDVAVMISR